MRTEVSDGSILIDLHDEVGRGAEVWITGFDQDNPWTGHLKPNETVPLSDGNGWAVRMGDMLVWVTPAQATREVAEAA